MTVQRRFRFGLVTIAGFAIVTAGCATTATPSAPAAIVLPAAETAAVATADQDAADDAAIWAAPTRIPAQFGDAQVTGFIAGTDKKAGLYIYGLDGRQMQFLPDGLLNNVDLREAEINGRRQIVIGASDRRRMGVALYLFDPAATQPTNQVRPWGFIPSDVVEPYGFCMGTIDGAPHAVLISTDGEARIYRIDSAGGQPQGREVRRFDIGSQSEGCAVDEEGGSLYVGEEAVGLWRYPLSGGERSQIQAVGDGRLVADVEGVALLRDRGERFLIVSSQGDSAFAVWRMAGEAEPSYVGRFRVGAANGIDAVTGTDGVDALGGAVGPFGEGLVVVQDDVNEGAQNFKLVDWREVRRALGF